jgi:hypothetical protein
MGKTKGLYNAEFPVGSKVRIADVDSLNEFAETWEYHHPLENNQLQYAGTVTVVKTVSFYHGGDELYTLEDIPGIWHEQCLAIIDN